MSTETPRPARTGFRIERDPLGRPLGVQIRAALHRRSSRWMLAGIVLLVTFDAGVIVARALAGIPL